jgi:hypothetical protein
MSYVPDVKRYDGAFNFRRSQDDRGLSCPRFRLDCGKTSEASMSSRRAGR